LRHSNYAAIVRASARRRGGPEADNSCGLIVIEAGLSLPDKRPEDMRLEASLAVVAAHAARLDIGDHRWWPDALERRFASAR